MSAILQTPTLISISPFDPSEDFTFGFIYSGNQATANRLVVTDNETSSVVYDTTVQTMKLEHVLPANTLTAGKQYSAQIQVFDEDENCSHLSSQLLFYCFSVPTFILNGVSDNMEYKSPSLELTINYSQSEGEEIRSLQYLQYSYDKTIMCYSNTLYTPTAHTFYELKNKNVYYFRAIGETVNGIPLDTGYIKVNIQYTKAKANLAFEVENNYAEGYVQIRANIKDIGYTVDGTYTLEDGLLVLDDSTLTYHDGFNASGDFVLYVEAKKLPVDTFLTTNSGGFSLSIVNICDSYYCQLHVDDSNYSLYSSLPKAKLSTSDDKILSTSDGKMIEIVNTTYDDDELIIFEVKRIGHLYKLSTFYRSELET